MLAARFFFSTTHFYAMHRAGGLSPIRASRAHNAADCGMQ
jgi:hypothetical protein